MANMNNLLLFVGVVLLLAGSVDVARGQPCQSDELARLNPTPPEVSAIFGIAVSISGNTAVIGAREDGPGTAYVFEFDGTEWIQAVELSPLDLGGTDEFGGRVAISGGTIVVGAPHQGSGAVYVFQEPSNGWTSGPPSIVETQKLTPPGADVGSDVAVCGNTIVVGAEGSTGTAFVFCFDGMSWSQCAELNASDSSSGDRFGSGVSCDGDTVVIGADQMSNGPGAAYVFEKPAGAWDSLPSPLFESKKLTAFDGTAGDRFGFDVAVCGDTVVVGAFTDDDGADMAGSAYVFERDFGGPDEWGQAAKLTASDAHAGATFGVSVSLDCTQGIVLVGANDDRTLTSLPGAAYVFVRPATGWSNATENAKLTASDGLDQDEFGASVSLDAGTAIIGAPYDDDNGDKSGSAYVFGYLSDCDANDLLDLCDRENCDGSPWCGDCQADLILDACQLDGNDCNTNGFPDECEVPASVGCPTALCLSGCLPDCNENCIPDACEVPSDVFAMPCNLTSIQLVTVGNPGNVGELSGMGAGGSGPDAVVGGVEYEYRISAFEITAAQYTQFLNAVADDDPNTLYDTRMSDAGVAGGGQGCNIQREGTAGNYSYYVDDLNNWGDRPVNFVTWGDAVRFANWLHNGQPTGPQALSTTEDGSYFLNGAMSDAALMAIVRMSEATYVVPSENEWYKAAFHKNDGATSNYFDFPTSSDGQPSNDLVSPDPGDHANFWISPLDFTIAAPFCRTRVADFENSASPYGTFDQAGNVSEWTDTVLVAGVSRITRGGSYDINDDVLHANIRQGDAPLVQNGTRGFRVSFITLVDCNSNGIPDQSEVPASDGCPTALCLSGCVQDCNENCIPDECEVAASDGCPTALCLSGCLPDCNENCIPDECETDTDGDGLIDACDTDDDSDGVPDVNDADPLDPFVCRDVDADSCDDCSVTGANRSGGDPANDGLDTDGDGICDAGDPDDDNDGVLDGVDICPTDPACCEDVDGDTCDDCSVGTDGFGPLPDNDTANDGLDTDGDGICNAGDGCPTDPQLPVPGTCGCGLAAHYSCEILCEPPMISAPGLLSFTSAGGTTKDTCDGGLLFRLYAARLDITGLGKIWRIKQDCTQVQFGGLLSQPKSVLVDVNSYWPGGCGTPNLIIVGGQDSANPVIDIIYFLNPASGAICEQFPDILDGIGQMALQSTGRLLIGSVNGDSLFALEKGAVSSCYTCVGLSPRAVTVDDNDNVYVACSADGVLRKLNPDCSPINEIFASGLDGAISLAIAPAGIFHGNLFAACGDRVMEVDLTTGLSSVLLSGLAVHGIAFDPDGYMHLSVPTSDHIVKIIPGLPGDMDGSGTVDLDDAPGFVAALLRLPDAPLPILTADMNGDDCADGLDVQGFVDDLVGV